MAKKIWWKNWKSDEFRVALAGAGIAFFFTHGLPLWNDDYYQWLSEANAGIFTVIGRVLSPLSGDAQAWGYSDRPVQVLLYKILHLIFSNWGTGYFFVKSLIFGSLCGFLYSWMRKLDISRRNALSAMAIFALSANVGASLIWHSDFGVYSQLILVLLLSYSLKEIESGPKQLPAKISVDAFPKSFQRFIAIFFAAVYFGTKLKGDVRLVPIILSIYLAFFDRKRLKLYAAPFAAAFLATLPWSARMLQHLPPFLGGSGWQGWTYASFSLSRVVGFLASDALSFSSAPQSLVGAMGFVPFVAAVAYAGYLTVNEKWTEPNRKWGLFLIWGGVVSLACGVIGPQSPTFMLRYLLVIMVPATVLLAMSLEAASREFGKIHWFKHALTAGVVAQCLVQVHHLSIHRRDLGHTMVAADTVYRTMVTQHPNDKLVFAPGYLGYGYDESAAPSIRSRQSLSSMDELSKMPVGSTYVAGWTPSLDTRLVLDTEASGCGTSLFDLIVSCGPTQGAFIHRFVGDVPEIAQAAAFEKQNNWRAALDTLNAYLRKEPRNQGAAFVASLYAYHAGDSVRMDELYESFGAYFPGHPVVNYNWGLAKQGTQKYAEARRHLEDAYALVPRDYGIGFNLAETYNTLGKKSRALATVSELIQAFPNNPELVQAKERYSK